VLNKYQEMQFKGLDMATQQKLQLNAESGIREIKPIQKGLTGIASRYDKDTVNS
jgi:hypothetical protein